MTLTLTAGAVAAPDEFAALVAALAAAGLPTDDVGEPGRLFWRFTGTDGAVAGHGGLELYGADALLRSVVVDPARRRRGVGRAIVGALETVAAGRRVATLFLLTTTAADVFAALGYVPTDRAAAPPAIAASRQFADLCPSSAAFLMKHLAP